MKMEELRRILQNAISKIEDIILLSLPNEGDNSQVTQPSKSAISRAQANWRSDDNSILKFKSVLEVN